MRVDVSTEDSGLTGSTYELITSADSEPREENYTESVSESVSSLDFQRPDDVLSLAETEQTHDDDESFVDEDTEQPLAQEIQPEVVPLRVGGNEPALQIADDSELEEEAQIRSSMEYAQHSLKTPSMFTPEASKMIEQTEEDVNKPGSSAAPVWGRLNLVWDAMSPSQHLLTAAISTALPSFLFAAAFSLLFAFLCPPLGHIFFKEPTAEPITSTITATTTYVYTIPTIATFPPVPPVPPVQPTTSAKGTAIAVIDEKTADEWLFGTKRPDIQFSPLGEGVVMIRMDSNVKRAWLKRKNCLSITAFRAGERVKMEYIDAKDGLLVRFPKRNAHGVVKLLVHTTCRPSVTKLVRIHFGKGIMEEVFDLTRNLAHDISGLIPVAAHEAERCLAEAKDSFRAASDTVASNVVTISDKLLSRAQISAYRLYESMGDPTTSLMNTAQDATERIHRKLESAISQISEPFSSASDVKVGVQESLLDAQLFVLKSQISAKMWWLRVSGRQQHELDQYGSKAKALLADKRREGEGRIRDLRINHHRRLLPTFCRKSQRGCCRVEHGIRNEYHAYKCK